MALKLGEAYTLMVVRGLSQHDASLRKGEQSMKKYAKESDKATAGMGKGFAAIGGRVKGLMALLGVGGILGVVNRIVAAHDVWHRNMQEIVQEARKASTEMMAFLALQEPGRKAERGRVVSELGIQYGIADRGELYNTVQAIQSVTGTFELGVRGAAEVFKASLLGLPTQLGRELEIMGISTGERIGETLRLAYAAGEVSGRTPTAMAQAARALSVWADKAFMFALAGRLAGMVRESELGTYMMRMGGGLLPTGGLGEWFAEQGVPETATQKERFMYLAKEAGKMGPTELETFLKRMGMTEERERRAIRNVLPEAQRIAVEAVQIQQEARSGLFERELAEVEKETPMLRRAREAQRAETIYRERLANSTRERAAHEQDMLERARAIALTELGVTEGLSFDFVDDERVSAVDVAQMAAWLETKMLTGQRVETTFGRMTIDQFTKQYRLRVQKALADITEPLPEPRKLPRDLDREVDEALARIPLPAPLKVGDFQRAPLGDPFIVRDAMKAMAEAFQGKPRGIPFISAGMGLAQMWPQIQQQAMGALRGGAEFLGGLQWPEAERQAPQFFGFESFARSIQERIGDEDELDKERNRILGDVEKNLNALPKKIVDGIKQFVGIGP